MNQLTRLLREPLLHFLAIGGLIFLLFGALAEPSSEPIDTIIVGPERIETLSQGFRSVWRRSPSDDELRSLIDNFVREEIYYREALALGLDRNDAVIRRRLRQKMEFLSDSGADLLKPAPGELEAYYAKNQQNYSREPRLAFEQIFLGETPNPETIKQTLSTLQSDPASEPSALGKRTLLPARLALSPPDAIDGVFGKDFFMRLSDLPSQIWAGPIKSAFGQHLVRILETQPARTPPLKDVRETVLRDWKAAKAAEIRELHYAKLRKRFVVEIHDVESAKVVKK